MKMLRETLIKQRRDIFAQRRQLESDWQKLGERDTELEEEAQKADLASLFDQLDEREIEEIEEIDLALSKMATGSYGICENCQARISSARLEALPTTRLCGKCAKKFEEKRKKLPRAAEVLRGAELPAEFRNLSAEEICAAIFDYLRGDGRIDLDELNISCQKRGLFLEGTLPSEAEHQILLRILSDVMGFAAILDHLQIDELAWEREDRTPGKTAGLEKEKVSVEEVNKFSEDVFEAQEEGTPYVAPDRPPAETE